MIQKIDKYGNTSTDDGRVIILDKYANIKKVNKSVWGSITGTLTDQIDLTTYLSINYYPLTSNPAGYLTSADVTLQNAYTNSIDGQIILDTTRGSVKIKGSVTNSVLFDLVDLAGVNALSFLSTGDIECRPNMSIYYDAFNSIGFDTIYGVLLKSFDYTKADGRIQYATDYTSLYTSRTLIDKGYADAHYLGTGSAYTLPIASSSVLGGVKIGYGVSIAGDGTISVSTNYQAPLSGTGFIKISGNTITYDNSSYYLLSNPSSFISLLNLSAGTGINYNNSTGVITSTITQYTDSQARLALSSTATGLTYTNTTGVFSLSSGYLIPTIASYNNTNWDTAFTQTLQWNGGSTNLVPVTGRTSLGATTVGSNLFTLANSSAITFIRINADNSISTLDASTFRTAIGAGTSSNLGTVTSVAAITLGTTGTDLSSSVANETTTPVITLNVPTASATNRGVLSSTDWATFNNKQNALGYTPVKFIVKDQLASSTVTGIGETVTGSYFVAANTFSPTDSVKITAFLAEKTGVAGTCTMRVKISTSAGGFGTAQLLATYTTSVSELWCIMTRSGITLRAGNIRTLQPTLSRQTDVITTSGIIGIAPFNTTVDNWFFTSLQLSNLSDSVFQSNFTMTN